MDLATSSSGMWLDLAVSNSYLCTACMYLCLELRGEHGKLVHIQPPTPEENVLALSYLLCHKADYSTTSAGRLNAKFHRPACVECLRHNSTASSPGLERYGEKMQ